MKKLTLIFTIAVILIALLITPVFAADVNGWVLLLHGGSVGADHVFFEIAKDIMDLQLIEEVHIASVNDTQILTNSGVGKYAVIIFSDYTAYQSMETAKKQVIDNYCLQYSVGQLFLFVDQGTSINEGQVTAGSTTTLINQQVNSESPVLYVTKDGGTITGDIPGTGRLLIPATKTEGYEAIASAGDGAITAANVLLDKGEFDGIKRIFFGSDFIEFWLHDLLFVDSLRYLAPVDMGISIVRYFSIDIDDIFQPNDWGDQSGRTVKIQQEDVFALLDTADVLSQYTTDPFKWSMGFNCGWYGTQAGGPEYNDLEGDQALVFNGHEFYWFDHLPEHQRASEYNQSEIESLFEESTQFAVDTGLDIHMTQYILPPYNDGIYPVYDPLYDAMLNFDYKYTASNWFEEGIIYKGVRIAPRHSAGIYSQQYSFSQLSRSEIDETIEGGPLFFRIFHTQVTFFWTHQSNFARDRIGNYLFENLFAFFDKWTNYQFESGVNDFLVNKYFEIYFDMDFPDDDDDDDSAGDDDDNQPVPHDDDDDQTPPDDSDGSGDDNDDQGGACCG